MTANVAAESVAWRERAAQLRRAGRRSEDAERERGVQALLSVPCPEPVCRAPETVPCVMGIGVPVSLVRARPVAFCHHARMASAIVAGVVSKDDVLARYGPLPEPASWSGEASA